MKSRAWLAPAAVCLACAVASATPAPGVAESAATPPVSAPSSGVPSLPSYGDALLRMVLALVGVSAGVLGAAWVFRRLGEKRARGGSVLQVIESRSLGPRQSVHLMKVGDEYLLIGVSDGHIATLAGADLDAEDLAAAVAQRRPGPKERNRFQKRAGVTPAPSAPAGDVP